MTLKQESYLVPVGLFAGRYSRTAR